MLCSKLYLQVADFGLSKEEIFDGRNSGLKGTYGYMDPAYISTSKLTTQSDIYSFGIIVFELITAIHPHQNLMEYVNLVSYFSLKKDLFLLRLHNLCLIFLFILQGCNGS